MKENLKHLSIRIYGRVQGINFRSSAQREAQSLNVGGLGRNEPDGSVLIEAEGNEENLEKFIKWCEKGPLFAKVDRITTEEKEVTGYQNFEIKY